MSAGQMFREVPLEGMYRLRPMTFWEQALWALRRRRARR